MYVKIRKIGAKLGENDLIINISKKASIEELREMIEKEFKVKPEKQLLLYKGKQVSRNEIIIKRKKINFLCFLKLVNDHKIMDYDIRLNDVIQLMIKLLPDVKDTEDRNLEKNITNGPERDIDTISQYYKIGDLIDVQLSDTGGWYEAKIIKIFKRGKEGEEIEAKETDLYFKVKRFVYNGCMVMR